VRSFVLLLATLAVFTLPATAQAQASFGALAAFHDDFDLGVGAYVGFPLESVHEQLRAQADFTLFFPGTDGVDYFEINGNALYDIPTEGSVTPFVLGGLNIARVSVDTGDLGEAFGFDGSTTDVGLNIGGGVTFETESLRPSVGARLELGGGEGLVVFGSLGIG
jgi:hypothetical protein